MKWKTSLNNFTARGTTMRVVVPCGCISCVLDPAYQDSLDITQSLTTLTTRRSECGVQIPTARARKKSWSSSLHPWVCVTMTSPLIRVHFQSCRCQEKTCARKHHLQQSIHSARTQNPHYLSLSHTMVTMVTIGGDLQPGCLADRLLTGLGQPQINP